MLPVHEPATGDVVTLPEDDSLDVVLADGRMGRLVLAPGGHMNLYGGSVACRACELLRGHL